MVPRENNTMLIQILEGQTKSIMIFLIVTYCFVDQHVDAKNSSSVALNNVGEVS